VVTIHFQPLADQIYVYADGSYAERSPSPVTMDITYSHQGTRGYISNIRPDCDCDEKEDKFTKEVWRKLKEAFIKRGLLIVDYEHKGKVFSMDVPTGKRIR